MPRPIATVQLGVARFFAEVSDRSDAELVTFVRGFARALALQKTGINEYADELMVDVELYREKDAQRKAEKLARARGESGGIPRNPPEAGGSAGNHADSVHSQLDNQSITHPTNYSARTLGLLDRFPTKCPRPEGEGGVMDIAPTEAESAALDAAVLADPSYPWEAAVEAERGRGKAVRRLSKFLADRPAPTPRLRAAQERLTAPKGAPAPEGEVAPLPPPWDKQERFDALVRASVTPRFTPEQRAELDALTEECREHFKIETRRPG